MTTGKPAQRSPLQAASPADVTPRHLAERILNSRNAVEGEKKIVTTLFADIVNSSQFYSLDPEEAADRVDPAIEAMMNCVHQYEGTVTSIDGDGIQALFGAPIAHEDHAVRASLCGIAMQEAIAELNDPQIRIRVGLDSGTVLIRSIGHDLSVKYDATGESVVVARRLETACRPGQVTCSAETRKLIGGFVDVRPLEASELKNLDGMRDLFEISRADMPTTRWQVRAAHGLTTLVGRGREITAIGHAFELVRQGQGQALGIVGDAGVGKSRLVHEFLATVRDEALIVEAPALPEGQAVPYAAISQLLRTWLAITSDDSSDEVVEKLNTALQGLDQEFLVFSSALLDLLNIDTGDRVWRQRDRDERQQIIKRALKALLIHLATSRSVVVVAEDLHWLDEESLSIMDTVVDCLGAASILLLATYRHEHLERWNDRSAFSRLRLDGLNLADVEQFLDVSIGNDDSLGEVRKMVAARASGTPLFLEEMIRHLADTGVLVGDPGAYRTGNASAPVDIPDSVQTVIAARIDRLPPESKDLLQTAALIGTNVGASLLAETSDLSVDALATIIAPLEKHDFLVEKTVVPESEYTFKHALVRDVALQSISRRRRRRLHRAIVDSIEKRHHNRLEQHLEALAHHAASALMWEKAVDYGMQAARKALELSAYQQCVRQLNNTIDLLEKFDEEPAVRLRRALDLRLALRAPLGAIGDIRQMKVRLDEANELAVQLNDDERRSLSRVSHAFAYNYLGDLKSACEASKEALELAQRISNEELIIACSNQLAQTQVWAGDYQQALAQLMPFRSVAVGPLRDKRIGTAGTTSVLILGMICTAQTYIGRFDEAAPNIEVALKISDELGRPYDRAISRWYKGFMLSQFGESDKALPILEEAIAICDDAQIDFLKPVVATSLGSTYTFSGEPEKAEAVLDDALRRYSQTGLAYGVAYASLNLAFASMLLENREKLIENLKKSIGLSTHHGFAGVEVVARRLQAIVSSQKGPSEEADAAAARALSLADEKGMLPDVAHTHMVLARLATGAGKAEAAGTHATRALGLYKTLGMTPWLKRASIMLEAGSKR